MLTPKQILDAVERIESRKGDYLAALDDLALQAMEHYAQTRRIQLAKEALRGTR